MRTLRGAHMGEATIRAYGTDQAQFVTFPRETSRAVDAAVEITGADVEQSLATVPARA